MGFLSKVVKKAVGSGLSAVSGGMIGNNLLDWNQYSGAAQQADANAQAMKAWSLANDYNHPVNQMARLKAAGLNPYLVYGSGSVAGNTTSSPALVGGGIATQAESTFRGLGNFMQVMQGSANLANTHAQTRASNAGAVASGAQAANLNAQTAINTTKAQYEKDALIADIDYKQALARKTNAEADITQGEADLLGSVGGAKGASSLGSFGKTVLRGAKAIFSR